MKSVIFVLSLVVAMSALAGREQGNGPQPRVIELAMLPSLISESLGAETDLVFHQVKGEPKYTQEGVELEVTVQTSFHSMSSLCEMKVFVDRVDSAKDKVLNSNCQ